MQLLMRIAVVGRRTLCDQRCSCSKYFYKMADNGRLTAEQKAKVMLFFAETKSVTVTQRHFCAHFSIRWVPAKQTICRLKTQFEEEGSVLERKRPHAPSIRTPENMEALRVAVQRSPSKSTRTASVELGISRHSVQRILLLDLHMFPYKITVMHKLADRDKKQGCIYQLGKTRRGYSAQYLVLQWGLFPFGWSC
jgi:hypothetical protein